MTYLRDSKIAKQFDIPIYRFILQVILAIIGLVALWYALVGRVTINEKDIMINAVYGQETRKITTDHIELTKGEPLTELQIQNKVDNLEDDVQDHSIKINKHEDSIVVLDRNMAVQKVQYENIMDKLDELIDK